MNVYVDLTIIFPSQISKKKLKLLEKGKTFITAIILS